MKKKNSLQLKYLILLVVLVIYGFYKNGIYLYYHNNTNIIGMFKPLLLLLMSGLGAILGIILKDIKKSRKNLKKVLADNKDFLLEVMIWVSIAPISSNALILFLITIFWGRFFARWKTNNISLFGIILIFINTLLKICVFDNARELSSLVSYSSMDMFLGMNVGGIFSTNIFFILVVLILLSFDKLYKKEISISACITFIILSFVPAVISGNYTNILPKIFGYNILFSFVFILPSLNSSCYTRGGKITSGVICAVLTYFLLPLASYASVLVSIFLISVLKDHLDRLFLNKKFVR